MNTYTAQSVIEYHFEYGRDHNDHKPVRYTHTFDVKHPLPMEFGELARLEIKKHEL